jgi:hypothetical protein
MTLVHRWLILAPLTPLLAPPSNLIYNAAKLIKDDISSLIFLAMESIFQSGTQDPVSSDPLQN